MTTDAEITFGDNVRILRTAATERAGYADRRGQCIGITTPSQTNVEVIGELWEDVAYNIDFGDAGSAWFVADLLERIDHGGGTKIRIGDKSFVRDDRGGWRKSKRRLWNRQR